MHNSERGARGSPVAVAPKVTGVITQTVGKTNRNRRRQGAERESLWWGDGAPLRSEPGRISERTSGAANYPYGRHIISTRHFFFFLSLSLAVAVMCNEAPGGHNKKKKKTGNTLSSSESYTCTEWIHSGPSTTSAGLTPRVCAYKWHSKVCVDGPCSYSRSLVSKAC